SFWLVANKRPMMGRSEKNGTPAFASYLRSLIKPEKSMVPLSGMVTVVLMERNSRFGSSIGRLIEPPGILMLPPLVMKMICGAVMTLGSMFGELGSRRACRSRIGRGCGDWLRKGGSGIKSWNWKAGDGWMSDGSGGVRPGPAQAANRP